MEMSPAMEEEPPHLDVKSMVAGWGTQNGEMGASPTDKRKTSYERYSAFALPPLMEEKTPVASPVASLSRNTVPPSIAAALALDKSTFEDTTPEPPAPQAAVSKSVAPQPPAPTERHVPPAAEEKEKLVHFGQCLLICRTKIV